MKKINKPHCKDFKSLIEEAIKRLNNGDNRLVVTNYPLKHVCLNGFFAPDIIDSLASDYCIPSGYDDIESDFYEEISLLENLIDDANIALHFSSWQKEYVDADDWWRDIFKKQNRRAYAIQLWDWYAIPWRYKNGHVYIIWSPGCTGTPIIHSYPTERFLKTLSSILENRLDNEMKVTKERNLWGYIGISAILIVIIIMKILLSTFF